MEQIFVCNFPDAVTSRVTFLRFCTKTSSSGTHSESEPSRPSEDNVVLRKVSKSRYTSSIFVSEGEWNEFHAQVSKVVYVTVQIASGARMKNARHSGNAAIINPHFKCCLLKSELNCHWRLGGGEREHFETFTAPEDSFYGADTRICSAREPFQLDFEIQGNTGLVSLVFEN